MKLAEILTGPEKWCQLMFSVDGQHCLVGALRFLTGAPINRREYYRLQRVLGECGWPGWDPMIWNDAMEREWDEVALVVDAYDRDRMLNP